MHLDKFLAHMGYEKSAADAKLYQHKSSEKFVFFDVYVVKVLQIKKVQDAVADFIEKVNKN